MKPYVIELDKLGMQDVEIVGGKNASLGEMISKLSNLGVAVPGGLATTSAAHRDLLQDAGLNARINGVLYGLDVNNTVALTGA